MMVSDAAIRDWVQATIPAATHLAGAVGAVLVVAVGSWLAWRAAAREERTVL
jgi:hypothetical protein